MNIDTGLAPKIADLCAQIEHRLTSAEAGIARMDQHGPDIAGMEAATIATDFVAEVLSVAPLFDIAVPEAERSAARLGAAHAALDRFDRVLRAALGPDTPPGLSAWAQKLDRSPPAPIPQAPRAAFLMQHSAVIDGAEVTLADIAGLRLAVPEVADAYWDAGFLPQSSAIAEGFAACLVQTYADRAAVETALAGTLDLPVQLRPATRASASAGVADPADTVFTSPAHLWQAAQLYLGRSNHWGAELSELFAQGCVSIGGAGPDFPLTLCPDPDALPLIHVPFTGHAGDGFALFHQIGHALHRMRSAKSHSPMAPLGASVDELVPVLFERLACDLPELAAAPVQAAAVARSARAGVELDRFARQSGAIELAHAGALDRGAVERYATDADMTLAALVCGQGLFKPLALSSFAFGSYLADKVEARVEAGTGAGAGAGRAETIDDLSRHLHGVDDLGAWVAPVERAV
jgi:hypothetical protein